MISASELAALPTVDKIRIITELWDQIACQSDPIHLPDWVLNEADRRLERLERDPNQGLTEEQVWQRADAAR